MELKLDRTKDYALALGGGGAKGAYEVGVWQALEEDGIRITAVSGTSVGAINGAFVAMEELELAKRLWCELTYSKVMEVDDDMMSKLFRGNLAELNLVETARSLKDVVANGGFEVDPLLSLFREYVDEKKVMASPREYYIITYSLTDRKELELRARDLAPGSLHQMMLASAYLPVFKNYKMGGKRYMDGGVADEVPVHVLVEKGYRNILSVCLNGIGVDRRVTIPDGVEVSTITPSANLGSVLNFDPVQAAENMKTGYYDAKRFLYGLTGERYCLERTLTEEEAHGILCAAAAEYRKAAGKPEVSLRTVNERILPRLAAMLRCPSGDYYDLFLDALETGASEAGLDRHRILTDRQLLEEVREKYDISGGQLPRSYTNIVAAIKEEYR